MEKNTENLYLVYTERITDAPNSMGLFEYEFFFSETPETVWAADWNQPCPSACDRENLRPELSMHNCIERLYTSVPLICIGDNSCLSCQDMIDGIIACAWEDISEYEEYPEPIRLVFKYGEKYEDVEDKLARRSQFFSTRNINKNAESNNE